MHESKIESDKALKKANAPSKAEASEKRFRKSQRSTSDGYMPKNHEEYMKDIKRRDKESSGGVSKMANARGTKGFRKALEQ